jgi:glycosyltransferase involved in cell wall biosynthesis
MANMKLTLGIPILNQEKITKDFFRYIDVNTKNVDEIIIVDNGSEKPISVSDYDFLRSDIKDKIKIIRNEKNVGVRGALNQIWKESTGDIICYTHNDVMFSHYAWDEQIRMALSLNDEIGILGCYGAKGIGADNIYQVPYEMSQLGRIGNVSNAQMDKSVHGFRNLTIGMENVAVFDGFFMAIKKELLDKTEGFSDILPQHHNYDNLICIQSLENGYENIAISLTFEHIGGQTDVKENWNSEFGKEKNEIHAAAHPPLYEYCRGLLPIRIEDIYNEENTIVGYELHMNHKLIKQRIYE